jgi:putative transposase
MVFSIQEGLQMKKRFSEEQIIAFLREAEGSSSIRDVCRKHNITEQTFFRWRNKYGGMEVPDVRKLKGLAAENANLKKLLAEQMLVIDGLKEFAGKK